MSTAIYLRVSTDEQTTAAQMQSISIYLAANNISEHKTYSDEGISGLDDDRPALSQLLADCKNGKVKRLIISSLDRLGRRLRRTLELIELLKEYGVQVIVLRENIDIGTPTGMLVLSIFGAIAQHEHAVIKSRCKAGIAAAKARGVHCGRPKNKELGNIKARILTGATAKDLMKEFDLPRSTAYSFIGGAK